MLKRINPEDLNVGQECYIKVVTEKVKISDRSPVLRDIAGNFYYPSWGGPIYTLDDQPNHPDPELEMLVNVATALMINDLHFTENEIEEELGHKLSEDKKERAKQWASAYKKLIARDAADLIAACKQIKEGEK